MLSHYLTYLKVQIYRKSGQKCSFEVILTRRTHFNAFSLLVYYLIT